MQHKKLIKKQVSIKLRKKKTANYEFGYVYFFNKPKV